ncbi:ATP-binding cassette domain-containing protein [Saccharothrix sp. S26]|nr:ATP-binding cassette domain-containing protein [Saccharothrix sp. S26]MCE7001111.1 ATP-binding cassette domain-containing protein [Saccharothrix sp. S26]
MRTAQLALRNVTKSHHDRVVLDAVSSTVKPGEKVGVIGDNGSGKSTLLAIVATRPRRGHRGRARRHRLPAPVGGRAAARHRGRRGLTHDRRTRESFRGTRPHLEHGEPT